GEVPFSRALALMGDRPTPAREKVLLASALGNPSLALRELLVNLDLPFAARLLEPVILIVPAETVAIASGASRNATRIRSYLAQTKSPELIYIRSLIDDSSIGTLLKQRAAVFARSVVTEKISRDQALAAARDNRRYFSQLIDLRLKASADEIAPLDRFLTGYAQPVMLEVRESGLKARRAGVGQTSGRDLYLLL